jgi:hypothetical protein
MIDDGFHHRSTVLNSSVNLYAAKYILPVRDESGSGRITVRDTCYRVNSPAILS